ncbi:MAG: hypothetical protein M0004_04450 [Actinomycetota bacterium]|nr:hypothetical protein [Actinomycetota bacterium]
MGQAAHLDHAGHRARLAAGSRPELWPSSCGERPAASCPGHAPCAPRQVGESPSSNTRPVAVGRCDVSQSVSAHPGGTTTTSGVSLLPPARAGQGRTASSLEQAARRRTLGSARPRGPERYEQLLEAVEETDDIDAFDAISAEEGDNIAWDQVKAELGWS